MPVFNEIIFDFDIIFKLLDLIDSRNSSPTSLVKNDLLKISVSLMDIKLSSYLLNENRTESITNN